ICLKSLVFMALEGDKTQNRCHHLKQKGLGGFPRGAVDQTAERHHHATKANRLVRRDGIGDSERHRGLRGWGWRCLNNSTLRSSEPSMQNPVNTASRPRHRVIHTPFNLPTSSKLIRTTAATETRVLGRNSAQYWECLNSDSSL